MGDIGKLCGIERNLNIFLASGSGCLPEAFFEPWKDAIPCKTGGQGREYIFGIMEIY